jgi:hypothetical protein
LGQGSTTVSAVPVVDPTNAIGIIKADIANANSATAIHVRALTTST